MRFRNRSFYTLPLCLPAALLLSACGGGNSADPVSSTPGRTVTDGGSPTTSTPITGSSIKVSGKVLQVGYLSNTQVCFDSNDNHLCDANEPSAITDASGNYSLTVPAGKRGNHLLALITPASIDSLYPKAADDSTPIKQGWVWVFPLEYAAGSSEVTRNISPLTSVYHTRMMSNGRNRLSNKNAVLTRAGKTDDYSQGVDFDYVQTPPAGLQEKLIGLVDYLSNRAETAGQASDLIDTAAALAAWYSTYNRTTAPIMDASKISDTTLSNNLSNFAYRYFHTATEAASEFRNYVIDNGGWVRDEDEVTQLTSQGLRLSNAKLVQTYEQWKAGSWTAVSYPDSEFFTLDSTGELVATDGTDALQPRDILAADGNLLSYKMPGTGVRYNVELSSDVMSNYYLEDWLGPQLSATLFGYSVAPTEKPTCASSSTATTAASWFTTCRGTFVDEYLEENGGLEAVQNSAARAEYYDVTQLDALLKLPLTHPLSNYAGCTAAGRAEVNVLGKPTCNWMGDASTNHQWSELFAADGVKIESWTLTNANSTPASVPRQALSLTLNEDGTGSIKGIAAANRAATDTSPAVVRDVTEVTEAIEWAVHPKNAQLVLINWPENVEGQVLPAHFSITGFSLTPSTDAAPNPRQLAITLQDGVFMAGQYYGEGSTSNYRYLNKAGLEVAVGLLQYEVKKLFHEGGFQ